ncbi:hypothetical protein P20429_4073 [Pseudoalteromonas sp. BSi20429]|nr:hypothetical protein P20429_4073 [Pseudoalteromonas sp. BSi20429]
MLNFACRRRTCSREKRGFKYVQNYFKNKKPMFKLNIGFL